MGLPILTLQGQAFAARMGSSLLTAVGMTDGIATSLPDYIARAVDFRHNAARYRALKSSLAHDKWGRTLGDSASFTKRFESAVRAVRLQP